MKFFFRRKISLTKTSFIKLLLIEIQETFPVTPNPDVGNLQGGNRMTNIKTMRKESK